MVCEVRTIAMNNAQRYHYKAAEAVLFHRFQLFHTVKVACDIWVGIYGQSVLLVLFDVS